MQNPEITLSPFDQVLDAYKNGRMIILIDDADRENEGDLCIATDFITEDAIKFMSTYGRGLICLSISAQIAKKLGFPYQVENNASPFQTPFTVTVDHIEVAKNGMLPYSRVKTMKHIVSPEAEAKDFISPGTSFPLIANPAGVLGRNGQTEGSFDLSRLCGLSESGVICEILAPDGTMLRGKALSEFAHQHNLLITSVAEIAKARLKGEILVRQSACSTVETNFGKWLAYIFQDDATDKEHIAMVYGDITTNESYLTRIHSECLTGDVFGSLRCDCGDQLSRAQEIIVNEGAGIILYLRQEGRGIGLTNKLIAYALQEDGFDTVEANLELGFAADERDFQVAVSILQSLKVEKIKLLTNNPDKIEFLASGGIFVTERVPLVVPTHPQSQSYIEAKKSKLGHLF